MDVTRRKNEEKVLEMIRRKVLFLIITRIEIEVNSYPIRMIKVIEGLKR